MKRLLLLTVALSLVVSCGGRKQIEKALYAGNYDHAISNALKKLDHNKHKKRKQQFIIMLEDAYHKAVERDLRTIAHLKKDGNPEHYRPVYELYANLEARQNAIRPVLPLKVGNKTVMFEMADYTDAIVDVRNKLSDYKYNNALSLMQSTNKGDIREAHSDFKYIEHINPNYKDVRTLIDESRFYGSDYVLVSIKNNTHQIIPQVLEDDLLSFNTYGLNNYWTVYHASPQEAIDYDYGMQLRLKHIHVSPERIKEKQILRERNVVDGWEYLLDDDGNVAQDSLGNDIKVDRIIRARCRFFKFEQFKAARVTGKVVYTDLRSNAVLETFPLDSEFIFENIYGRARGDRRALTDHDRALLDNRRIPFPTNEQMVFDTGEHLKHQLKDILNSYSVIH